MTRTQPKTNEATPRAAEIVREYGPFAGADKIHGVTHDGRYVWAATGAKLIAFDPETGKLARTLDRTGDAGTAFDGTHLYQIAEARIDKIDPKTGNVLASIPAPGQGRDSGLAWAEGSLWVGQYRDRKILKIDPNTGAVLRTIESNRFVTGVSFVDGELWHGTWEGDESELRHVDAESGAVLERLAMPPGTNISGLESDGADLFYCGGGPTGKVRAVRRPAKRAKRCTRSPRHTPFEEKTMADILHRVGIKSSRDDAYQALATRDGLAAWWTNDTRGESEVDGILEFRFAQRRLRHEGARARRPASACSGKSSTARRNGSARRSVGTCGKKTTTRSSTSSTRAGRSPSSSCITAARSGRCSCMSLKSLVENGQGAPHPHDVKIDNWN